MSDKVRTSRSPAGFPLTRRQFTKTVAGAAVGVVAAPTLLRARNLNDKLNIAVIGAGGRGGSDTRAVSTENIVALCDVDWRRAAGMFRRHKDAKRYRDFREMLDIEDKKIDAVVVAIPDHMHAAASMAAIKRGKHVYCEKPLTHDVYEARMLADAARKAGVATQMGNQGQASEGTRLMCETIWDGAIGDVREVHVWTDRPMKGINGLYWPQGSGGDRTAHGLRFRTRWPGTSGWARRPSVRTIRITCRSNGEAVGLRHRRPGRHWLPQHGSRVPGVEAGASHECGGLLYARQR